MRAVVLAGYGGPEVLQFQEVPDPVPGPSEVRVRVAATALNRADLLQRAGRYPPPEPRPAHEIPGLEFAGTIEAVGPGVTAWQPGQRVCGLLPGGGYAELVVTHERLLIPVPSSLSLEEAAAVPEVFLTAFDALAERAGLRLGEVALIHAGGSGVGTAALQLAKAMGASVLVTVGSREKAQKALALGADQAIVYREASFPDVVLTYTNGRGADVIIDFVGGPYLEGNLRAAALEGRIVCLGTLGGAQGELPLGTLMAKRLRLMGATLRARPVEEKMRLTQLFIRHVWPWLASGRVRPVIDRVFPWAEVAAAHQYMAENRNFGKIVLRLG